VFWPLLSGKKDQVIQEARQREIDDQHFKYAGVSGVDKPRIVEVGFNAKYLADLKARVGLGRAVQALLASGDIEAIWVFDTKLGQLAGPEVMGPSSARFPSEGEMASIKEALHDHQTRSVLLSDALSVIAPIKTQAKGIIGAALVRIPTDRMWQAVQNQLKIATVIALAVLGTGFLLSLLLAKRQVAPIEALTAAATSVEERKFDPTSLDAVTERRDEIGRLARVQQVEIASNRKKLTVFFSDIVGFTETTENLDSEELTSILNRYLNEMASLALKYGATLDKYVGDAIIAFFGDPETKGVAEDAKACVAMAVERLGCRSERRHSGIRPSILPCTVIGCDDDDGVRCFRPDRIHDAADVGVKFQHRVGVIAELRLAPECRVRVGRVVHLHEVDVHEEGLVVLGVLLDVRHRRIGLPHVEVG
jgi:class 3 adenylate cyclase